MAVNTGVGLSLNPRIPFGKGRGLRVCPSALLVLANAAHSLQPMTCSASGECNADSTFLGGQTFAHLTK